MTTATSQDSRIAARHNNAIMLTEVLQARVANNVADTPCQASKYTPAIPIRSFPQLFVAPVYGWQQWAENRDETKDAIVSQRLTIHAVSGLPRNWQG
jgi:hypothetical protein